MVEACRANSTFEEWPTWGYGNVRQVGMKDWAAYWLWELTVPFVHLLNRAATVTCTLLLSGPRAWALVITCANLLLPVRTCMITFLSASDNSNARV